MELSDLEKSDETAGDGGLTAGGGVLSGIDETLGECRLYAIRGRSTTK